MRRSVMKENVDLKKLQEKLQTALKEASHHLEGVGKEAKVLVKRGESEFARFSKVGRANLEILALTVKKEQLYRQIGMKVWEMSTKGKLTTAKLKAFCKELSDINESVKKNKRAINSILKKEAKGAK